MKKCLNIVSFSRVEGLNYIIWTNSLCSWSSCSIYNLYITFIYHFSIMRTFFLPSRFWVIFFNWPDNDDNKTKNQKQTYEIIEEYMKNQMISTFLTSYIQSRLKRQFLKKLQVRTFFLAALYIVYTLHNSYIL